MSRWFRLHDEILDDPKVQRLSGDDFKAWINLLCLASRNGGKLPPAEDIAFSLRLPIETVSTVLERLLNGGLIVRRSGGADGGHYAPHRWEERQYKSDTSTDRVKRYRQRSKPVTETPPDTEAETDTPLDKSNGASDIEKALFDAGVRRLMGEGKTEAGSRSLIGKWKRDQGAGAVLAALAKAEREGVADTVSYVTAIFNGHARRQAYNPEVLRV